MTVIPNWLLGARDQLEDGLAGPRKRLLDARVRTGLRAGWHEGVRHTPLLVGGIAFLWYAAGGWRGIPVFAAFWAKPSSGFLFPTTKLPKPLWHILKTSSKNGKTIL